MRRILKTAVNLVLVLTLVVPAMAADYDLVINNGRVMDPETNHDAVANVGIKDGKIAVITKNKIKGKETIDATGLVVAPGFIDGHQHCLEPYAYRLMVRDGRTTIMDLEIGAFGEKVDEWYKRREGNSRSISEFPLPTNSPEPPFWTVSRIGNTSTRRMRSNRA